jgi:hypothetical protein
MSRVYQPGGSHWLDPIIREQAAHYGLTPEQHAHLMDGAAKTQERIDTGELPEDDARGADQ